MINFDLSKLFEFHFDSFFINADPLALLGFFSLLVMIAMIWVAKRFSNEKRVFLSTILFMLFYVYLYVFWWWAAIIKLVTGKKVAWGHKSSVKKEIS